MLNEKDMIGASVSFCITFPPKKRGYPWSNHVIKARTLRNALFFETWILFVLPTRIQLHFVLFVTENHDSV